VHVVTASPLSAPNQPLREATDSTNVRFIYVREDGGVVVADPLEARRLLEYAQSAKKFAELDLKGFSFTSGIEKTADIVCGLREPFLFHSPYRICVPHAVQDWWRDMFIFNNTFANYEKLSEA